MPDFRHEEIMPIGPMAAGQVIRAAQYVRMSTDLQQYSIQNQVELIEEYARRRNIQIVRTYADEGRSGLRLDGRPALQRLLQDVQSGAADFSTVLVFDVSRWGRFQDIDESAYYEQVCKRAGIRIVYCAETFENDDSLISALIKSLKRAMAGEFSRELSAKVFTGQCNLVRRGFWQGAQPGYGLRRFLISATGDPKGILAPGERKSIQSDRVVLVPGPSHEVKVVQRIFQSFVVGRKTTYEIANQLNDEGVAFRDGRHWNKGTIRKLLTNEKYAGHNVFNRVSRKLSGPIIPNPPDLWIRSENAFTAIVDPSLVASAIRLDQEHCDGISNDEMIRLLRNLYKKAGHLTCGMITRTSGMPHANLYRKRFGTIEAAFAQVGYRLGPTYDYIKLKRSLVQKFAEIASQVVVELERAGLHVVPGKARRFVVNGRLTLAIIVVRCTSQARGGPPRWALENKNCLKSDMIVAIRTDKIKHEPIDYFLIPTSRIPRVRVVLAGHKPNLVNEFRQESLTNLAVAVRACVEAMAGDDSVESG